MPATLKVMEGGILGAGTGANNNLAPYFTELKYNGYCVGKFISDGKYLRLKDDVGFK